MEQLIFFDTFSAEPRQSQDIQLDVIHFSRPVEVTEVRVIPLGATVDFPGGIGKRLGATNPSQFDIEFYVSDLNNRAATTFKSVGTMQYNDHGKVQLVFDKKFTTDGLLLRGNYSTLTLAVYGVESVVQCELKQVNIVQPPPDKTTRAERIQNWLSVQEACRNEDGFIHDPSRDLRQEWDGKQPRSPPVYEIPRQWEEKNAENVDYEREQPRHSIPSSRKLPKERETLAERSLSGSQEGAAKAANERRRDSRRGSDKETSRGDRESEEYDARRGDSEDSRRGRKRDRGGKEREAEMTYGSGRDCYEDDSADVPNSKLKRDRDWDDHRSDVADRSGGSLRASKGSIGEDTDGHSSYGRVYQSKKHDSDCKGVSVLGGLSGVPVDVMEAISDDEDIPEVLPDGEPAEEDYGVDYDEDMQQQDDVGDDEQFGYEEIMSDDDLPEDQFDDDWLVDEWEDWLKEFNPEEDFQTNPLMHLHSPVKCEFEAEVKRWKVQAEGSSHLMEEETSQVTKLLSLLSTTSLPSEGDAALHLAGDSSEETGELWVQAVEQAVSLVPVALPFIIVKYGDDHIKTLHKWVDLGLDFNQALMQHQPVFKIRQMKVGLRLVHVMLQCCNEITLHLMNRNVLTKLYSLFNQPHMALSIKLMIIRCMDMISRTPVGLRCFLDLESSSSCKVDGMNGYELVLHMTSASSQTRVKVALLTIIRKIHLLELCHKINEEIVQFISPKIKEEICEIENVTLNALDDAEMCKKSNLQQLSLSTAEGLTKILRLFRHAPQLLAQLHRCLPASSQFQLSKMSDDPYPHIYIIFDEARLLETIATALVLMGHMQDGSIMVPVHRFINTLLSTDHGILYLASHPETLGLIIRIFLQLGNSMPDQNREEFSCSGFGTHMMFMFHALQQLDGLAGQSAVSVINYAESVASFNHLTALLVSPMGRQAVYDVLSAGGNLRLVLPYLKLGPGDDRDNAPTRLACFGYAADLVGQTVKFSKGAASILEKFGGELVEILAAEEGREGPRPDEFGRMADMSSWVGVAEGIIFSYDHLGPLVDFIKDHLETPQLFSGQLISRLRILKHLAVPPDGIGSSAGCDDSGELVEELKYKYATVQLFSVDLLTHLNNILSKLISTYAQPSLHSCNFMGTEGALVLALLEPSLSLQKNLLILVIQARNTSFKDLTSVPLLVQTYILLQAFPPSSSYCNRAVILQREIVEILLGFTQPLYSCQEGEEVLSKSLWTLMMAEVFKCLMSSPHSFVPVMRLILELLPLPLPMQCRSVLTDMEAEQAVTARKLWSAHLLCLTSTIQDIVARLSSSATPALSQLLRSVCVTLSDLSAPMALLIGRASLDVVSHAHRQDQNRQDQNCPDQNRLSTEQKFVEGPSCNPPTARFLAFLSSLVSHPPTKVAILHLLNGGSATLTSAVAKAEEKYSSLMTIWCQCLTSNHNSASHLAAQESIATILQSLCDHEISLLPNSSQDDKVNRFVNLSAMPSKEIILAITEATLKHLSLPFSSLLSIHPALRILIRLLDHDFGFYHVVSVLEKKRGCLLLALQKLNLRFSNEPQEKLTCLHGMVELCLLLLSPPLGGGRTLMVSPVDLASYVGWKVGGFEIQVGGKEKKGDVVGSAVKAEVKIEGNVKEEMEEMETDVKVEENQEGQYEESQQKENEVKKMSDDEALCVHPFKILEKQLVCEVGETEAVESLYEELTQLISHLERELTTKLDFKGLVEPEGAVGDHLSAIFASRQVWIIMNKEQDLHSMWWCPPLCDDEPDEHDLVSVSLLDICRQYAADFDLLEAVKKLVKGPDLKSLTPQKLSKSTETPLGVIRAEKRGRGFVAPLRGGRSFSSRGMGNRSDMFRSRMPNTSRPPSLHVDDFVALQNTGQHPTGPTGYNQISFGRGKYMLDAIRGGRGRGRGERGRGDRGGRFFSPRSSFRGDTRGQYPGGTRGLSGRNRSSSGWGFRGEASRGSFRGGFQSNMGSTRYNRGRGPFSRGNSPSGGMDRFPDRGHHMRGNFR